MITEIRTEIIQVLEKLSANEIKIIGAILSVQFYLVWWMATMSADMKRAKEDIDGVAGVVGTKRAMSRKCKK